jgi:RNA polymerase sigma-70 factor (ECF subfamily)
VVALVDDDFETLAQRAKQGDDRAFAELVTPLVPKLRGYLRALAGDELDDLVDEVLFTVYRRLDHFEGSEAGFRSWVFAIAHNLAIDFYRRRQRRPEPVDTSDPKYAAVLGVLEGVDAIVTDQVVEHRLREVLDHLPDTQRRVLLLRTVADLSVEETATVIDRSPGAVRVLQHRALAVLRRRITIDPR